MECREEISFKTRRDLLGEESLHGRIVLDGKEILSFYEFI